MLLAALLPISGFSQTASKAENDAAVLIAECMVKGPPEDWQRLYMVIELPEAGAPSGRVRYLVARESAAVPEPYVPCDGSRPAQILMESRKDQTPERRSWIGARFIIHRNGRFDLNYDYTK
jgi:hypothetical protein